MLFDTTLEEAAGLSGIHRWSLILPGAHVSLATYQTVVAVRCAELVQQGLQGWEFGRFHAEGVATKGRFIPVLWDGPRSEANAVQDIGTVVDALHNAYAFEADPAETTETYNGV